MSDGTRRITAVSEIIKGMTGDVVAMQDIFIFEEAGYRCRWPCT